MLMKHLLFQWLTDREPAATVSMMTEASGAREMRFHPQVIMTHTMYLVRTFLASVIRNNAKLCKIFYVRIYFR